MVPKSPSRPSEWAALRVAATIRGGDNPASTSFSSSSCTLKPEISSRSYIGAHQQPHPLAMRPPDEPDESRIGLCQMRALLARPEFAKRFPEL